jgi:hypothetical protein
MAHSLQQTKPISQQITCRRSTVLSPSIPSDGSRAVRSRLFGFTARPTVARSAWLSDRVVAIDGANGTSNEIRSPRCQDDCHPPAGVRERISAFGGIDFTGAVEQKDGIELRSDDVIVSEFALHRTERGFQSCTVGHVTTATRPVKSNTFIRFFLQSDSWKLSQRRMHLNCIRLVSIPSLAQFQKAQTAEIRQG